MQFSQAKIKGSQELVEGQEQINQQKIANPLDLEKPKEMIADTSGDSQEIDDVLNNLWNDDSIDADLMAVESELFVLSAELYTN